MIQRPVDPEIRKAARIIALRCRRIIQCMLREEEWIDCDREFAAIAEAIIEELAASKGK